MTRRRCKTAVVEREVRAAIAFYDAHGWCWVDVVEFLCTHTRWRQC